MRPFIAILATIAFISFDVGFGLAVEFRTYRFVADGSLPYSASCGECGPPYMGATADVYGTFTVALDSATSQGTLVSLNGELTDYFNILSSPTDPILQPSVPPAHWGIIPAYASYFDPPFDGSLEVAGSSLIFSSSGWKPTPDGQGFLIAPVTKITMQGNEATFDMTVPIMDYSIIVTSARAILIPEPASIGLAMIGILFVFAHAGAGKTRLPRPFPN